MGEGKQDFRQVEAPPGSPELVPEGRFQVSEVEEKSGKKEGMRWAHPWSKRLHSRKEDFP